MQSHTLFPNKTKCKYLIDQKCKERISMSNIDHSPLLYINWLITTKCNYNCVYCYAKDIMQLSPEPTINTLMSTAQSILQFNPVVVVLSGGEPFLSPYIADIISYLNGKTSIIVDTNGSIINRNLLNSFKEKEILLRVSLDDVNEERNDLIRRNSFSGTYQTKKLISECLQIGVDMVIQTVVTKMNFPYLKELKEYLEMIGVKHWRLLPISNSISELIPMHCTSKEIHGLREALCYNNDVDIEITVQHEYDNERRGIILVAPNGTFLTINAEGKKVCIDPLHPNSPDPAILNEVIDWKAHYLRYIVEQEEE